MFNSECKPNAYENIFSISAFSGTPISFKKVFLNKYKILIQQTDVTVDINFYQFMKFNSAANLILNMI